LQLALRDQRANQPMCGLEGAGIFDPQPGE